MMRPQALLAACIALLIALVALTPGSGVEASAVLAPAAQNETAVGGSTISWSLGDVVVNVTKLPDLGAYIAGFIVQAYYADSSHLRFVSKSYDPSSVPSSATLKLYDYYNASLSQTVSFTPSDADLTLTVWSNCTICEVWVGDRLLTRFYVAHTPSVVSWPEELSWLPPLIPVAVVIAFGARGNPRDAGLGLIVAGIITPSLTLIGADASVTVMISGISIVVGIMILLLAGEER